VQVTVQLTLTLTVPDQIAADLFHNSCQASYQSPHDPSSLTTKTDAAGLVMTGLARTGVFHDTPMPKLAASVDLAPLQSLML
jgi:hypothetical protein